MVINMRYYKLIENGYIIAIGTGGATGTEIMSAEYDDIMSLIQNKPTETETIKYRLKTDLTWEQYEVEPEPPSDEIDDSEALEILLGGAE